MCGFTGIISKNGSSEQYKDALTQSLALIQHRGPDHQQTFLQEKIALAHARLSIIDNSQASNQPFHSANERYTLCFNGEIYNFQELRKELLERGIDFQTQGDTEVLLHWLIQFGPDRLTDLNGFFAFAFFDAETDILILARDRMGQKPLLYCNSEESFSFASELNAFKPFTKNWQPDFTALSFYMQLGYIPAPHSAIEGIEKLLPGEYLIYAKGEFTKHRYFELDCTASEIEPNPTELYSLMEDSIRLRLISDRPVGSFLSGGIDSSIVTALAAQQHEKLDTFSIGFDNNSYLDESQYAAELAKSLGTTHHRIGFESKSVLQRVQDMLDSLTEPFADSSAIAYFALAEYTRNQVVVALSGDGADELFGGYRKHLALNALNSPLLRFGLKFLPNKDGSRENEGSDKWRKLGRLAQASKLNLKERYWLLASFAPKDSLSLLNKKAADFDELKEGILSDLNSSDFNKILCLDQKLVLPNDMLHKADSMSMAHGLEVRSPFMDHRIVDFANKLKPSEKLNFKKGKLILRKSFEALLPAEIWNRPKKGFEVPLQSMLQNELQPLLEEYLNENALKSIGVFNPESVINLLIQFKQTPNAQSTFSIWSVLVAQYWFSNKA